MANQFEHLFPTTPPAPAATPAATPASGNQFAPLFPKTPLASLADPTPPAAADTGNSFWYDLIHPQTADLSRPQTWRDWATKTYYPTARDVGNAALDDVSMGSADYAQAKLTGEDIAKIRARTAASQAALGPMAPVINAVSYVAGPGKILGPLAAIGKGAKVAVKAGRAALEGGAAGATSSVGHQLGHDIDPTQVAEDAAKSAAFGVGGNWIGRGTAAVARPAFNAAQGAPGRTGDQIFGRWRAAAERGEDISGRAQIYEQNTGTPMDDVIAAQQIGTGPIAAAVRQAANIGTRAAAGHFAPLTWFSEAPGRLGEAGANQVINRVRNYATNRALDRAYDAANPTAPLNADTSGWLKAIQQGLIGGSLP